MTIMQYIPPHTSPHKKQTSKQNNQIVINQEYCIILCNIPIIPPHSLQFRVTSMAPPVLMMARQDTWNSGPVFFSSHVIT